MAHPKRKHSKQRSRKRRTHQGLPGHFGHLSTTGSTMGYNHRIDPVTGMYKGQQIVAIKVKGTDQKQ
ncbi:MAG: 50S ribosomal protein L32 [Candidatus Omnitrophica bacterium]|nr:50S ribosomal protein L32 [Candidatus Omnitrophota bacterium]